MIEWLLSLNPAETVFAALAIPATVVLLIQSVMLLFGFGSGHGDGDGDASGDIHEGHAHFDFDDGDGVFEPHAGHEHADAGDGVALFSIRGIVAFFTVGGWLGLALLQTGVGVVSAALLAMLAGTASLYGIYWIMKASLRLQSSGNLDIQNAVGLIGQVYIRIPAQGQGRGKVILTLQQRLCELEAITFAAQDIRADQMVSVTGVQSDGALIVQLAQVPSAEVMPDA